MAAVPRKDLVFYGDGVDTDDDINTLNWKRAQV